MMHAEEDDVKDKKKKKKNGIKKKTKPGHSLCSDRQPSVFITSLFGSGVFVFINRCHLHCHVNFTLYNSLATSEGFFFLFFVFLKKQ